MRTGEVKLVSILMIFILMASAPAGAVSAKAVGKISMIAILALIGTVTEYLIHRDEAAVERASADLGKLERVERFNRGLQWVEVRTYERGVLIVRDGVVWRVLSR